MPLVDPVSGQRDEHETTASSVGGVRNHLDRGMFKCPLRHFNPKFFRNLKINVTSNQRLHYIFLLSFFFELVGNGHGLYMA